jgi:putative DNA primase/helicase
MTAGSTAFTTYTMDGSGQPVPYVEHAIGPTPPRYRINPRDVLDPYDDGVTLKADGLADLLALPVAPRQYVVHPIIPQQGLVLAHAPRGTGKTLVAMGLAVAASAGAPFLRWRAPSPRRTLYLDGEMPLVTVRDRFAAIAKGIGQDTPDPDTLRIVTPDRQDGPLPDMASPAGQAALECVLDGVEFLILDNLSALCRADAENDAASWQTMQQWLLSLRRRGVSVLVIHHSGKAGAQRGTSRREDVLDTTIALRRPSDYTPDQGARFEVVIEKGRGIFGEEAKSFEVTYTVRDGAAQWATKSLEDSVTERVSELLADGMTHRQIATELGVGLATISRHRKRAVELGLPTEPRVKGYWNHD